MPLGRTRNARTLRRNAGRGFTLIETALATVIIGVGVVAIVEAHQAFMKSNQWSTHAATATFLGGEIREMTLNLPRHDPVTGLRIDGGDIEGWGPEDGEVLVEDFDDLDDFDGLTFAFDGTPGFFDDDDLPGPIDAFGLVIPEIFSDGTVMLDEDGDPVPMQGWRQTVRVVKVHPTDPTLELDPDAVEAPAGGSAGIAVDEYPLKVEVIVSYEGPFVTAPTEITRVTWIVPN
ncbi:MAG: prepilin-type N-terminal cleavage/methylation domain-containing protein [Phycisphaerales bacterium]